MSLYFFHFHECGDIIFDEEGLECAGLAAARASATEAARDVMSGEVKAGRLCLGCYIVISDASGAELDRVTFREALTISGL